MARVMTTMISFHGRTEVDRTVRERNVNTAAVSRNTPPDILESLVFEGGHAVILVFVVDLGGLVSVYQAVLLGRGKGRRDGGLEDRSWGRTRRILVAGGPIFAGARIETEGEVVTANGDFRWIEAVR